MAAVAKPLRALRLAATAHLLVVGTVAEPLRAVGLAAAAHLLRVATIAVPLRAVRQAAFTCSVEIRFEAQCGGRAAAEEGPPERKRRADGCG